MNDWSHWFGVDGRQNRVYDKKICAVLKTLGFLWMYLRPARPVPRSARLGTREVDR